MAVKAVKQAVETNTQPELPTPDAIAFDLEEQIADSLLDGIDWSKVKSAMLTKVRQRFFAWLSSGSDRPVNISQFPELAALPSHDDERAA